MSTNRLELVLQLIQSKSEKYAKRKLNVKYKEAYLHGLNEAKDVIVSLIQNNICLTQHYEYVQLRLTYTQRFGAYCYAGNKVDYYENAVLAVKSMCHYFYKHYERNR